MRSFIRTTAHAVLLSGIATMTCLPACVAAQETAPQDDPADAQETTEIVVTGSRPIAESEAAGLAEQRKSDALVSVAASDSVGRLPDQNIAQAASRLPGVGVQRDQGQARYINLRGSPKTWTTLSFDGITVISPEGRDSRFDSIPSALASKIIVRKAVTPDLSGETIAGNVEIVTRNPFDYKDYRIAAKAGIGKVELGGGKEYEGSLVVSKRFDMPSGGEVGFLFAGSFYERNMVTDNFENDWEPVAQDLQPGFGDRIWARETENKLYRLQRRNYSVSGLIDFRPTDTSRLFIQSLYTAFTDDELRDNYIFDLDDRQADNRRGAAPCTIAPATSATNTGYADVCIGNTPFAGTVYGVDINQRATLRAFVQSVFTNTLGGDHEWGNAWALKWRLNYSKSVDDRTVTLENRYESPSTRNLRPSVRYDLTNPFLARVNLFTTIGGNAGPFTAGTPVTNIDDFQRPLTSSRSLDAVDTTRAYTAKFDLSRTTDLFGGDTKITFGAQMDNRTKQSIENELLLNTAAQFAAAGIPTTFLPASLDTPFKGEIPLGYNFRYFSKDAFLDQLERAKRVGSFQPITGNFYKVREQIYAAYVMANSQFDWGSIIGGARVEHVKNRGQALVPIAGVATRVTTNGDSTLIFPSLHFNYNLDDSKKLRISFNSGAARPDYDELRPNFTFNDSNQTVSGGNPEAKPERAYGVDAYVEWYVQPRGFISFGAFYKRAEDVLFNGTRTFGLNVLDTPTLDRSNYTFSTITNGGSGYIYGVEAAINQSLDPYIEGLGLPEWLGGFGMQANVTLNKSQATKPDGSKIWFPGTSKVVYNLGAYYEKYGLSLRASYQKRSAWLDELGSPADGGDFYWATDDELDLSARYAINKQFEIYADAANILNGAGRRFVRSSEYTIEWERFGPRYTAGVRVTF